jgi:WD40 repeat protein
VFLAEDGRVKILDLGLARIRDALEPGGKSAFGTPAFMAPEQRDGDADERSDVFAAGVMLAQLLDEAEAPGPLQDLIDRCQAKERQLRPADGQALLDDLLSLRRAAVPEASPHATPYRYLESFTEADEACFFGRNAEIMRLRQMVGARPLVAVVGASGAGKTSLVMAGLVPSLRRSGERWCAVRLRPGSDPIHSLRQALGIRADDLAERPGQAGAAARSWCASHPGERLLVFVDQMEEVYTHGAGRIASHAFTAALLSMTDDSAEGCRVILAVREDFLSRFSADLRDRLLSSMLVVVAPDAEGLAEALRRPAQRWGFDLEEGLAEKAARTLEGEVAPLPILQLAASRLWEKRDVARRLLTAAALQELGGLTGVLSKHADAVLRRLDGQEDIEIARSLHCRLVTAEGTKREVEVRELLSEVRDPERAERVLRQLVEGRLLTASRGPRGEQVELAHESLIEGWSRLRLWLDEDREQRRFRELLLQAARHWAEGGRPGDSLWRGDQLDEALRWRRHFGEELSEAERAFLDAARAVRERAWRRRRWWLTAGLVVTAATVVGALIAARVYRAEARAARRQAILQTATSARDPLLSALLLMELGPPEPAGALDVGYRIAAEPLPIAVLRHEGVIYDASFSRDGTRIATASADGTVRVFQADGGGDPVVLRGPTDRVFRVAFSPDGSLVAGASWDGTARIWRADGTGSPVVLRGHTDVVMSVDFSPDGRRLVTGSIDGSARIWSVDGVGEPIVLAGHDNTVHEARFSPDGMLIGTVSQDATARIWHADGRGESILLRGHARQILRGMWSPDGSRFVTQSSDATARVWRKDGAGTPVVLAGHALQLSAVAWSRDGARIATGSLDGTARVWNADGSGEPMVLAGHEGAVTSTEFSPDGSLVLTGSDDGTARLWQLDTPGAVTILRGDGGRVSRAVFSPDGQLVVAATRGGSARVWKVFGPVDPVRTIPGDREKILGLHLPPDGTRVLAVAERDGIWEWPIAAHDGRLVVAEQRLLFAVFDPAGTRVLTVRRDGRARLSRTDGTDREPFLPPEELQVASACFSNDGARVAVGYADGSVRVWPADGSGAPLVLEGRGSAALFVGFTPDRSMLVRATLDGSLTVWRLDRPGEAVSVPAHRGPIRSMAIARDGQRLATVSVDGSTRIWGLPTLSLLQAFVGEVPLLDVAWSPDGTLIATTSSDRLATIRRADGSGTPVVLRGHQEWLWGSFTPDGRRLVTNSQDGTVRVWPTDGASPPLVLQLQRIYTNSFTISADGARLATGDTGGTVRVYRLLDLAQLLARLRAGTRACLTEDERVKYLGESRAEASAAHADCERTQRTRTLP